MINEETKNYQSHLSLAWKKAEITAKIIGAIAVPTILGFGGWIINDNINRRELDAKYVDIAAKALQLDQLSDPFDQSSVRDWAFKIINKYTDNNTKILDSAKIQLVDWFTLIITFSKKHFSIFFAGYFILWKSLTIKEINDDKKTNSDPTEIIICLPSS
jgi:hypothetical protein